MNREQDLMQRLAVSQKIMQKHGEMSRNTIREINNGITVEEYQPVNAKYNLPEEFMPEQKQITNNFDPSKPIEEERILKSKLPDEIKRLMIEQPIVQQNNMGGQTPISEEVIQGAQRLMNINPKKTITENNNQPISKNNETKQSVSSNINMNEIKSMLRDVVRDTVRDVVREELKVAGMLVESNTNSNEIIQFKVGKHLFVGNVTKIKKLQ